MTPTTTMEPPARNAADGRPPCIRRRPRTAAEAGLSDDLLTQLVLKLLYHLGDLLGTDLASASGVEFSVVEPTLEPLRLTHQFEIVGLAVVGAPSYRYRITDEGRRRTPLPRAEPLRGSGARCRWRQYQRYLKAYRAAVPTISTRERVAKAFSHLVLSHRVLDQVGTAAAAGPLDVRLRTARQRQDGHRAGRSAACSKARLPSRTPSRSTATSSACSIPSTTPCRSSPTTTTA